MEKKKLTKKELEKIIEKEFEKIIEKEFASIKKESPALHLVPENDNE